MIGGSPSQIVHFLRWLLLKITSGLKKNIPWLCFLTQETQKWHWNYPKAYSYRAIDKSYQNFPCGIHVGKKRCATIAQQTFLNLTLLNTINLIWWKMSSSPFLVYSQSFWTNFKSDNISELILLNYYFLIMHYIEFLFEKSFVILDKLSIK